MTRDARGSRRRGRQGARVHAVPRDGRPAGRATSRQASAARSYSSTAVRPRRRATRWSRRFQEEARGPRVFVLSVKAGGTGLNLTAASHVFHYDRWWNPAVEDQATDRAYRIGQRRAVQVHKLLCAGTVEEKIDRMLEQKRDLAVEGRRRRRAVDHRARQPRARASSSRSPLAPSSETMATTRARSAIAKPRRQRSP